MRSSRLAVQAAAFAIAGLACAIGLEAAEKASDQVSPFFGSFSYNIPIEVAPFHGLEPRLALGYSSEGRNGMVGVGWGFAGFSAIERVNAGRGTPRFDSTDTYLLDGQQVLACISGSTAASCIAGGTHYTRDESFLKISFDSGQNKFIVRGRDGTRTDFSPVIQTSLGTLRWGQTSTVDTKGNTVTYSWACDSGSVPDSGTGDCYPGSVSYNGYSVTLYRETRPDQLSYGAISALRTSDKRLRSIVVAVGGTRIRGYKLSYATSAATGRSLLTSVQQFGKDLTLDGGGQITGGTSLPAQTFAYQADTAAKSFTGGWSGSSTSSSFENVVWTNGANVTISGNDVQKTAWDEEDPSAWDAGAQATRSLNGDGYVEFMSYSDGFKMFGLDGPDANSQGTPNWLDFAIVSYDASNIYAKAGASWFGPFPLGGPQWFRIEISAGVVSFRSRPCVGWGCTGSSTWSTFYTSTLTPAFPQTIHALFSAPYTKYEHAAVSGSLSDSTNWCPSHKLLFADFNGDGRTDAACQGGQDGTRIRVTTSTGSGFGAQTVWLDTGTADYRTGDFNGDGKTDLIRFDGGTVYVATSTGSAFSTVTSWGFLNGCDTTAEWGVGEFNGDGKADVWCRNPSGSWLISGISNGTSLSSVFGVAIPCTTGLQRVGTLDFDGDGKDDLYCQGMESGGLYIYRGTGSGFESTAITSLSGSFCDQDPANYVWGDFNADGKTDVACRWGKIALSTGLSFSVQGPFSVWCGEGGVGSTNFFGSDLDGDGSTEFVCNNNGAGSDDIRVRKWLNGTLQTETVWKASWCSGKVSAGDFTGDGKSDIYCDNVADAVAAGGTAAKQADLLIDTANGLGGHVKPSYVNSSTFGSTNGSGAKWAVSQLRTEDGRGGISIAGYAYDGGLMDRVERRFLGFHHARVTKPCITGESQCPYTENYFRQDLPSAGKLESVEQRDGAGRILTSQVFEYAASTASSTSPAKSLLTGTWTNFFDGSCSGSCAFLKRTRVTNQHDNFGNVTQTVSHGDNEQSGDEVTTTTPSCRTRAPTSSTGRRRSRRSRASGREARSSPKRGSPMTATEAPACHQRRAIQLRRTAG